MLDDEKSHLRHVVLHLVNRLFGEALRLVDRLAELLPLLYLLAAVLHPGGGAHLHSLRVRLLLVLYVAGLLELLLAVLLLHRLVPRHITRVTPQKRN